MRVGTSARKLPSATWTSDTPGSNTCASSSTTGPAALRAVRVRAAVHRFPARLGLAVRRGARVLPARLEHTNTIGTSRTYEGEQEYECYQHDGGKQCECDPQYWFPSANGTSSTSASSTDASVTRGWEWERREGTFMDFIKIPTNPARYVRCRGRRTVAPSHHQRWDAKSLATGRGGHERAS